MGLVRTNVMLDSDLWEQAKKAGKPDERSGSWILNQALRAYLSRRSKKPKAKEVAEPGVLWMPLNSGEHAVSQKDIDDWTQLYPAVDILAELRAMIGWLNANPAKRKTSAGINRFINSWLKKAQDKGGAGYEAINGTGSKSLSRSEQARAKIASKY